MRWGFGLVAAGGGAAALLVGGLTAPALLLGAGWVLLVVAAALLAAAVVGGREGGAGERSTAVALELAADRAAGLLDEEDGATSPPVDTARRARAEAVLAARLAAAGLTDGPRCPGCAQIQDPDARFCKACGAAVPAAPAKVEP